MDEAYAVVQRWEVAFNRADASAVASLYAPGATIWGTLAQKLTASPPAIESYFAEAARAGLRVKLGEHVATRISDSCIIEAGHYDFTRTKDGQTAVLPARYSFAMVKQDGQWMILHHHSSMLPKPLG